MKEFNVPENLLTNLRKLLEVEYKFYQDLENLLIEERNALVEVNNETLTNINFQKESLLINIVEVKNKRSELLKEISLLIGIETDDITLTFLASNFSKYSKIFYDFKVKFKKIGNKIKSLNEINKHVIDSSLQFIKSSLNIMFQSSKKAVYTNYGKVSVNHGFSGTRLYSQKV